MFIKQTDFIFPKLILFLSLFLLCSCQQSKLGSDLLSFGGNTKTQGVECQPPGPPPSPVFHATVIVQAGPTKTITLKPDFLGLSYSKIQVSKALFNPGNTALVTLFKQLGPGVIRIVADSASDNFLWNTDPNAPCGHYGRTSACDLNEMGDFLRATNWKVLYGIALVNLNPDENALALSIPNTPANAASEAKAAAAAFGETLYGFEIGNEPDNYYNAAYGNPKKAQIPGYLFKDYSSPTQLLDSLNNPMPSWPVLASAIRDAAPKAMLTGAASGTKWNVEFAQSSLSSQASLLTRHYYPLFAGSKVAPSLTQLLAPDTTNLLVTLPEVAQAASAAKMAEGYRISECNSVAGIATPEVGGGVNTVPMSPTSFVSAFGAALWTVDFLFTAAFNQASGINMHGGGSNPEGYTPILDNGVNAIGVGPDYYGMLFFSRVAKGGKLLNTQIKSSGGTYYNSTNWTLMTTNTPSTFSGYPTTANASTLSSYAVLATDGSTDVVLNNKDPSNSIATTVVPMESISEANSILMTAPSLQSTSCFTLGGNPVNSGDGTWNGTSTSLNVTNNEVVVIVPPASALIVHLH